MSLRLFVIPLLLLATAVKEGVSLNVGYVTMPLFEMLTKTLPQDESKTADEYIADENQEDLDAYFAKVKVIDGWIKSTVSLEIFFNDKTTTVISDAKVLHERETLLTENLSGYNCTRWCYNVSVPLILNVTGWSEETLDGKIQPIVRIKDIHYAVVKAIEERFCCNMTAIAVRLGLDPVEGVKKTAIEIERFVPHVIEATVQCKADALRVTTAELAELLRTNLSTLYAYDLNQMDMYFFPAYEDLLSRKKLFETRSIITGVLVTGTLFDWQTRTMAEFANVASQFTVRDLEILYRWTAPQLFAIENIPMSIFQSGCTGVSFLNVPLFSLSQMLFGFSTNLPSCDVAFLLSRSFDEVDTKFSVSSLSSQNVLEIFRIESQKSSWFDIYELLQLNIDEGIWVETPTVNQIAIFSGKTLNTFTEEGSIPIAIKDIKILNTTLTLNAIMSANYASFLFKLLTTYGYSSSGLAAAAGITEAQLNSLTIQEAHSLVLDSVKSRYRISDVASLLNMTGVNTHVLINLPSFEWVKVVMVAIENAFAQSADAYSILLSGGGVQISIIEGGFPAIQVSGSVTYHNDRISPAELANCLNKTLAEVHAMSFAEYHQFHINSIVPLLRKKIVYETQTMESLLNSLGLDFDDVKSKSVAEVIVQLTGLSTENLQCLYGWNSDFLNTDLGKTFQSANETRLCNDFLGRTMFDIVRIMSQIQDKVCFLCTTDPCGDNTMCKDVPDSFQCTCIAGYTGNPIQGCIDIPECILNRDNCHVNATCDETPGSFNCTCKAGFVGDGRNCSDINECLTNPNRCGPKGICRNTIGSFYCDCESGYRWNRNTCVDIDECAEKTDNCDQFAICNNTVGSFTCYCPTGLTGDGLDCQDILECDFAANAFPCHVRADCTETFGSYVCQCKDGYTGDGKDCTDINECNENTDDCHANSTCFNAVPGFICVCNDGFTGDGKTCADIDECDKNLDNCHANASCINTIASFDCECKNGFNGNGTYCYVAEISFSKASEVINEGDSVNITFSLNGDIDSLAVVTINVGGTATDSKDYTSFTTGYLYNPGDPHTRTLTIDTIDDPRLEGQETITLTLSSVHSHVTLGDIPTMTITILDNDAATVGFSQQTYTAKEKLNSTANLTVEIRSGTVDKEITISVTTIQGTAKMNSDFIAHSEQISFAPGNTGAKSVLVPLVNDDRTERDEQFSVRLSTADADVNIVDSPATVTIVDDDVATIRFESNAYSTTEDNSTVTLRLLVNGERDVDLTARINTGNVAATAEQDYNGVVNRDINIPRLLNSVTTSISILEDSVFENDETFSVTLTSQSSPHLSVVNPSVTLVTIIDDDVVSVRFSQSSYPIEENATQVNVRVIVTGSFEKLLQLRLTTSNVSATSPHDYQEVDATITFNPGDPNERDIPIQIYEDTLIENLETFTVQLSSTDQDIQFPSGKTASINIIDDDFATARLQQASYTFNETADPTNVYVLLEGSIAIPVVVRVSTVHGSARWPSDFAAISNQDIEFRPGEPKVMQLALDIKDDNVVESTESFSVILSTEDNKVVIGNFNSTTINIIDNDQLRVNFSSPRYEADEDSGFAKIGLVLLETLETMVRVRLTPSNGTATEPEDFPLIFHDVTLDPGQARTVYYRVNITNDMLEEYSEHFFLTLSALDANVQVIEPRVANITIGESDDIFFCDDNARQYPCHIKADCVDVPGSFVCTCVEGYEGDGKQCTNKNECDTIECPFNATCMDTEGSYKCICRLGFRGDGVNCDDIHECAEDIDECHEKATCTNNLGSYDCECNEGWFGDGRNCSDINECDGMNDCHDNATCHNTDGSYRCECKPGFTGDGKLCNDIEECIKDVDECHREAMCTNTIGSYECNCNEGWSGNGRTCSDINECDGMNDCHNNATCHNTNGTYRCECKLGFTGDGKLCTDVDECDMDTDNCPANSNCTDTIGSFICNCNPGFIHRNSICEDVNECTDNLHNCHDDANCLNDPGTFHCVCKDGFTGTGTSCTNLDECGLNPNPCHQYANCVDTHGSFNCTCWPGFTGNGTYCEDIIDCILLPRQYPCDIRADCFDFPGGYNCSCPAGYRLLNDRRNCDDINECEAMTYSCHVNATCVNTQGSYRCECKENFVGDGKIKCIDTTCSTGNPCSSNARCSVNVTTNSYICICNDGYTGNGITCDDINECGIAGSCGPNTDCMNTIGGHACACKDGFTGNPYDNCVDIVECDANPCHANATCTNNPGSYVCDCHHGFTGNGTFCNDINECDDASTCDANANCTNTIGGHYCTCHRGFTGNGKSCTDINECEDQSRCPANSKCDNSPGSFSCECNTGFKKDGDMCKDINECDDEPCDEDGAVCANTPGSYRCTCPEELYNNGNFCHVFCPFKLDLAFIVDTSDSITSENFVHVKDFMTQTIGRMEIGENGNHIAAISFGNTASVFMRFDTITGADLTRRNLISRFANFTNSGGLTRIDLALTLADMQVFTEANGMRPGSDVRKVAVVITDGAQTVGPGVPVEPLSHIARRLQARDITVIAIAIGQNVPRHQLLNITNSIEENILEIDSFANLGSIINQFINTTCTGVDECALYDDACHEKANCKDTLGAYSCLCKPGYTGDGFNCQDINECDGANNCDTNADCQNTDGSYECACKDGYTGDGKQCQDKNECNLNEDDCHAKAECKNNPGSFTCDCLPGYSGDGKTSCNDVNECNTGGHNCHSEAKCNNTIGSFNCTCNEGYSGDGRSCADKNECELDEDDCHAKAECKNNVGSFTCECLPGYSGDGKSSCDDKDECNLNMDGCLDEAKCNNTEGSYTCTCPMGFEGDGKSSCDDINECITDKDNCHAQASCSNTQGSFQCTCNQGYSGDGKSCEASSCSPPCINEASCIKVGSEFQCACRPGYTGDGTTCTDVNECTTDKHNCHDQATCDNNIGSFACQCNEGWTGDGRTCTDINECEQSNDCNVNATCSNNEGSYQCQCKHDFSGDGKQCDYIDECATGNHDCHTNADCMNNDGNFTCQCKNGFSGDGKTCVDIDECVGVNDCHTNANCTNTNGTFTCQCKNGYSGDGRNCTDINECRGMHGCNDNAQCINTDGSYSCRCNVGYSGTGCTDIDECNGQNNCHSNADCTNTEGSYSCKCKTGFIGDGFTCTGVPGCENCPNNSVCVTQQSTNRCECITGYQPTDDGQCADVNECALGPCEDDQTCRNYPGTHECFCTSPGKHLVDGKCIDVNSVGLLIRIINAIYETALAKQTSAEFYEFSRRLEESLNQFFKELFANFVDSTILNLSNGSVVANVLLVFRGEAPSRTTLLELFKENLNTTKNDTKLYDYVIEAQFTKVDDYNECNPVLNEHAPDCQVVSGHSYCVDTYGSYSCQCLKGYEMSEHDICVDKNDDWWIVYAAVFGAITLVVLVTIILFCCLECRRNKELYNVHDDRGLETRPRDKRVDEEIAPVFPGTIPRSSSSGSQLLLGQDKSHGGSEKLAMYEVNPIYDSANG